MKKIFLLLIVGCLTSQMALSASQSSNVRQAAISRMRQNNSAYFKTCSAYAENFKADTRFSNHLRSSCTDFESERERVLSIIYPNSASSLQNSSQDFMINKANLSARLNASKLSSYKEIIDEYCKYNMSALAKKDPQACVRAKKLF